MEVTCPYLTRLPVITQGQVTDRFLARYASLIRLSGEAHQVLSHACPSTVNHPITNTHTQLHLIKPQVHLITTVLPSMVFITLHNGVYIDSIYSCMVLLVLSETSGMCLYCRGMSVILLYIVVYTQCMPSAGISSVYNTDSSIIHRPLPARNQCTRLSIMSITPLNDCNIC